MSELVDANGLQALPGSVTSQWFTTYTIADPEGDSVPATSYGFISQMCEYTLHLDRVGTRCRYPQLFSQPPSRWAIHGPVAQSNRCATRHRQTTVTRHSVGSANHAQRFPG